MKDKILIVIPSLKRGGAERVVSILSKEFSQSVQVDIALFNTQDIAYEYCGKIIDLNALPRKTALGKIFNIFIRCIKIFRLIQNNNYLKIYSFMESASIPALLACIFSLNKPQLILAVRDNPNRFPKYQKFAIRYFYKHAYRIVGNSKGIVNALISNFKLDNQLCHFIPNPAVIPEITNLRSDLDFEYMIAIGRLAPQKNFAGLIEGFSKIEDKKLHLVILGEGALHQALSVLAANLGISERVHLMGIKKDIVPYLFNARFFILTSHHEGWPNALVEALTTKTPSLAYNCDFGPREILCGGRGGTLFYDNSSAGITSAINSFQNQSHIWPELVDFSYKNIKKYDVKSNALEWLSL